MRKPDVDEVGKDPGLIENDDSSRKRVNRKGKTTDEWSSSSEKDNTILTSEEEFSNDIAEDIQSEQDDWQTLGKNVSDMNIDDWVLVKFPGKKSIKHYLGQIANITNDVIIVEFTRKNTFPKEKSILTFPTVEDSSVVLESDIVSLLPTPKIARRDEIRFEIPFHMFNIQ
ncbi:hypothetical protein JTB14_029027 [Gonioctena quinquepunctata]|nr:hypothetical protein JTB14_029027 [Gonioctena quinquepunctata]